MNENSKRKHWFPPPPPNNTSCNVFEIFKYCKSKYKCIALAQVKPNEKFKDVQSTTVLSVFEPESPPPPLICTTLKEGGDITSGRS